MFSFVTVNGLLNTAEKIGMCAAGVDQDECSKYCSVRCVQYSDVGDVTYKFKIESMINTPVTSGTVPMPNYFCPQGMAIEQMAQLEPKGKISALQIAILCVCLLLAVILLGLVIRCIFCVPCRNKKRRSTQ